MKTDNGARNHYVPVHRVQGPELHNTKNKKTTTERLEFKKFCPQCRKHQAHKEIK